MYLMSIKNAFINCFKFKGRATRLDFWPFFLLIVVLLAFNSVLGSDYAIHQMQQLLFLQIVCIIALVLCFIPWLSISWRRFHDVGKSGKCILFLLIPIAGLVLYLIWMARPSEPETAFDGE